MAVVTPPTVKLAEIDTSLWLGCENVRVHLVLYPQGCYLELVVGDRLVYSERMSQLVKIVERMEQAEATEEQRDA